MLCLWAHACGSQWLLQYFFLFLLRPLVCLTEPGRPQFSNTLWLASTMGCSNAMELRCGLLHLMTLCKCLGLNSNPHSSVLGPQVLYLLRHIPSPCLPYFSEKATCAQFSEAFLILNLDSLLWLSQEIKYNLPVHIFLAEVIICCSIILFNLLYCVFIISIFSFQSLEDDLYIGFYFYKLFIRRDYEIQLVGGLVLRKLL